MRLFICLLLATTFLSCNAQSNEEDDKKAILAVMKAQEKAWSQHDLEGFMKGYWKNDSLKFFGSRGGTYIPLTTISTLLFCSQFNDLPYSVKK